MSHAPAPIPPKKPAVDWEAAEPHYRAGILSLKELGEQHGCTAAAILKHARKHKWSRDLAGKIKAKAQELVNAAAVNDPVNIAKGIYRKAKENEVVEANASLIYQVRISHRSDIRRLKNLLGVIVGEIEVVSNPEGQGLIEQLMDATTEPESETPEEAKRRKKKQADLLDRTLNLPERVDMIKRAVETQDRLIQLDRQAFGITDKSQEAEEAAGKVLTDAERASRVAAILQNAMKRRAEAQLAEKPTVEDAA